MNIKIIIFCIIAILFNSCTNNATGIEGASKLIRTLIDADNKSDIKTVLQSYADTVEFHSAGKPPLKGIDNIRNSYEKLFKENRFNLATEIKETKVEGNTVIIKGINTGSLQSIADSSIKKINDNYTAFLIKDKSVNWKIIRLEWAPID